MIPYTGLLIGGFARAQNFVFPNLPLPSYRRRDRAQAKMREFYVSILEKRRASTDEVRPIYPAPGESRELRSRFSPRHVHSPIKTCSLRSRTSTTKPANP